MLKRLHQLSALFLALPRYAKGIIALSLDVILCILTVWLAFYLRLGEFTFESINVILVAMISIAIALPLFVVSGMYRAVFRYSGLSAFIRILRTIGVYAIFFVAVVSIIGINDVPNTIGFIQPLLLFFAIGGSRALVSFLLGDAYQGRLRSTQLPRALIYGAGSSGRQLLSVLNNSLEFRVIGFLDDDASLHGHFLDGKQIFSYDELEYLVKSKSVSHVLVSISSAYHRKEILKKTRHLTLEVYAVPSFTDVAKGKVTVSDIYALNIDDLLCREIVAPNITLLNKNIKDKVVMVTGAGGSIGGELCRQIIKLKPKKLLLVEISEYALYAIDSELESLGKEQEIFHKVEVIPLLASVQDEKRMLEIMSSWQLDTIYHAAAYKHVPLVEHNVIEGIKNNVLGTLIMSSVAVKQGVSDFVLISTDKAVRPTNLMGATKRLAEICLQALHANELQKTLDTAKTKFSMVRFGNVLNSSGSVIPKFRQQIRDGGPVTLTHSEITRYFMTIPEAAQLVIQAGAMAQGGEVFVLDMGEPVRIIDLARKMILLSGFSVRDQANPDGDIDIIVTGLRPGEKLYEELMISDSVTTTQHSKIERVQEDFIPWNELEADLALLESILSKGRVDLVVSLLQKLVAGYQPATNLVDWAFIENAKPSKLIN